MTAVANPTEWGPAQRRHAVHATLRIMFKGHCYRLLQLGVHVLQTIGSVPAQDMLCRTIEQGVAGLIGFAQSVNACCCVSRILPDVIEVIA